MKECHITEIDQALVQLIDQVQIISKENGNRYSMHLVMMRDNITIYQLTPEKNTSLLLHRLVQEWERFNHVWIGDMTAIMRDLSYSKEHIRVFLHEVDRINHCLYSEEVYNAIIFEKY